MDSKNTNFNCYFAVEFIARQHEALALFKEPDVKNPDQLIYRCAAVEYLY
jgi:hypothetical protein